MKKVFFALLMLVSSMQAVTVAELEAAREAAVGGGVVARDALSALAEQGVNDPDQAVRLAAGDAASSLAGIEGYNERVAAIADTLLEDPVADIRWKATVIYRYLVQGGAEVFNERALTVAELKINDRDGNPRIESMLICKVLIEVGAAALYERIRAVANIGLNDDDEDVREEAEEVIGLLDAAEVAIAADAAEAEEAVEEAVLLDEEGF